MVMVSIMVYDAHYLVADRPRRKVSALNPHRTSRVPRILRLNHAGMPCSWATWYEASRLYARDLVIWTLGDPVIKLRGGYSRQRRQVSELDIHGIVACRGKIFSRTSMIPPVSNPALFARDGQMCMYCGAETQNLTRDHLVPRSRGGADAWENVVAACYKCNHRKGNRLLDESGMELLALPYVPNFAEYLALINSGRILSDQMDFLKARFASDSRLKAA